MRAELSEIEVDADDFRLTGAGTRLTASLEEALALCLGDERRGLGGLLHLRCHHPGGRPPELTDNTLSAVLVALGRFKRAVLGAAPRREGVTAHLVVQTRAPEGSACSASLADLVRADLADEGIDCSLHVLRRNATVCVRFDPAVGRLWVAGADEARSPSAQRQRL